MFPTYTKNTTPLRLVGAHDALTARIGEESGFDGIWASGFEICASHGVKDDSSLERKEFLERVGEMAKVVNVPVIVDVDTGFEDIVNTIHLFEDIGATGVCIEDKMFPKRNSFASGPQMLEPRDNFAKKISQAAAARRTQSFAVVARTEALIANAGISEAIARMHTYACAGASAVIVHSRSNSEAEVIAVLASKPPNTWVGVIPTVYFKPTATQLCAAGADFVVYANQGMRAQVSALQFAYKSIIQTGSTDVLEPHIASIESIFSLQERCTENANRQKAKKQ